MILVTGASGFLGRHLVRYLSASGLQVRALFHNHPPDKQLTALPGVEWMYCDLLDIFDVEEAMQGISEIYHCAAIVSYDPAWRDKMLHFNPESTANIINHALGQGIRKMVYVSSIAAIGRSGIAGKELTEEEEWGESNYNSAYGISKYLAETEVWRGIGEGLNAVIINPGILLGDCEDRDPPAQLLKLAGSGFPFYTSGITAWADVSDVVAVMFRLMNSEVEAERFIISCGNYSYREIVSAMALAKNKKPPHRQAGPFLAGLAWRWHKLKSSFTGKAPLITRETAQNAVQVSFYNNEKLNKIFPNFTYKPVKQSIEAMITN